MNDNNKFIENAKQNARTISSELNELSSIEVSSKETFERYKNKSQRIIDLFKNLKPLLKEDRENLWAKFQQIGNVHRSKQEERKRNRDYASSRKKEIVVDTIREANNYAAGDLDSLRKASNLLKLANERMRPGWSDGFGVIEGMLHTSDGKMKKEDLEYCWQLWNEAKNRIETRRKEIFSNNYINVKEDLYSISDLAVYGNPYEAIKRIRVTKGKVFSHPMDRDSKDSLLRSLDEWWRKAQERIQEKKKENERKQKEWEERKKEKERKQKEWEARKAEKERKQREWEARKAERERKNREWEARKIEKERKQREWEERQRERERKNREWQERKLERERERERKRQEYEERKRNRGSGGRRKSSGGCYITTATCITLGKSDDCFELNSIRLFRDSWLINQKFGKKIISDYYKIAPIIVKEINAKKNKKLIYKFIWDTYLTKFLHHILVGQNNKAKNIYLEMVDNLSIEFLSNKIY